jgi:hypothetical protein
VSQSEIARLREQIVAEYQAASRVFSGFTPTAEHAFITAKQENLCSYFEELQEHMSAEDAMRLFIDIEQEAKKEDATPLQQDASDNVCHI